MTELIIMIILHCNPKAIAMITDLILLDSLIQCGQLVTNRQLLVFVENLVSKKMAAPFEGPWSSQRVLGPATWDTLYKCTETVRKRNVSRTI